MKTLFNKTILILIIIWLLLLVSNVIGFFVNCLFLTICKAFFLLFNGWVAVYFVAILLAFFKMKKVEEGEKEEKGETNGL